MKYLKRRPASHRRDELGEDPMSMVGNLFDVAVVFITALLVALFSLLGLNELLDAKSSVTLMKRNAAGEVELITKVGQKIKAVKMSKEQSEGRGQRLGTAYKLEDGTMIYVPE